MNTIDDENKRKANQFCELWLSTWRLTYGDEWVNSADMWHLKDSISDAMGNYYTLTDAQNTNKIDTKMLNGITHYKLNNPS